MMFDVKMLDHKNCDQKPKLLACIGTAALAHRVTHAALELGMAIEVVPDLPTLERRAGELRVACVLAEFVAGDGNAVDFLLSFRPQYGEIPALIAASGITAREAGHLVRLGAFDCLESEAPDQELQRVLELAKVHSERLWAAERAVADEPWRRQLVGESAHMQKVARVVRLIAERKCTVLITGETGSGKEMVAKAIHAASDRARKPIVSINCSAIPENLIEAELFGHVKGAFTGALQSRIGRFEQAHGGTLFLDEIGDLPFDLQAKLLRVLQEREIQRLGSGETVKIDVRVIAATNADLATRVQQGRFREDLYYRLNVVPIHVPALRERISDVPLLAQHFVSKICRGEGIGIKELTAESMELLRSYHWPGNVRQLENVVEHAVVMSGDRSRLIPSDFVLPQAARPKPPGSDTSIRSLSPQPVLPEEGLDYSQTLREFERAILQQALSKARGNKTLAADMLKLPRTTLLHKLRLLDDSAAA